MSDTIAKKVSHEIKRQLKRQLNEGFDCVFDKLVFVRKECGCIKILIKDSDVCITKAKVCKLPKMNTVSNIHKFSEYAEYIARKIVEYFDDHSSESESSSKHETKDHCDNKSKDSSSDSSDSSKSSKSTKCEKECAKPGDIVVDHSLVSSVVVTTEDYDVKTTKYTIKLIIKNTSDRDASHFGVSDVLLSVSGLCGLEDNIIIEKQNKKSVIHPVTFDSSEECLDGGHIIDPRHSVLKAHDVVIITYSMTSLLDEPDITSLISQVNIESCGKFLSETKLPLKTSVSQYQSNPNNTVVGLAQSNARAVTYTTIVDINRCITITGTLDIGRNATYVIDVNGVRFYLLLSNWVRRTGTNNFFGCDYLLTTTQPTTQTPRPPATNQGFVSSIVATDNIGVISILSSSRTTSGRVSLPVNTIFQRTFTSLTFCVLQCTPPVITSFSMVSPSSNPPQYQTGPSNVPMTISFTGTYSANVPMLLTVVAVNDATPTVGSVLTLVSISSASAAVGPFFANLGNLTCGAYTATLTLTNACGRVTRTARFVMYNPITVPSSLTISPSPVPNTFPSDYYYLNTQSIQMSIPVPPIVSPCVGTPISIFGIQDVNGNYIRGPSNTNSQLLNLLTAQQSSQQFNVIAFTRLSFPANTGGATFVDGPQISRTINVVRPITVQITSDITVVLSNGTVNFTATVSDGLPSNISPVTYTWYDGNTIIGSASSNPLFSYTFASTGTHTIKVRVSQPTLGNTTMTADSNIISIIYCTNPTLAISIPKGNYTTGESIPLSASLTFTNPLTATLYYAFASSAPAQPYANSINVNNSTSLYAIPINTTDSLSGSYKIYAYTEVVCNDTLLASPVQSIDVSLWNPVTITNTTPINIQNGIPFGIQLTATGGTSIYDYSVTTLPVGLSLSKPTPTITVISGVPSISGVYPVTITATDTNTGFTASKNVSFNVYDPFTAAIYVSQKLIEDGDLYSVIVDGTYEVSITGINGLPPYNYSYVMGGPSGFSLAGNTGNFTFNPTIVGLYGILCTVSDANSSSIILEITISVQCPPMPALTITSPLSPNNTFLPTGLITLTGTLNSSATVDVQYDIENTEITGRLTNVSSSFSQNIDLTGFDLVDGTYNLFAYPILNCNGIETSGNTVSVPIIVRTAPVITNLVVTKSAVLSGLSTAFTASYTSAFPAISFDWYISTQLNAPYATTTVPGFVYNAPIVTVPTTVSFTVRVNTNGGGSSAQYTPFVDILICPNLTATYQTSQPLYFPATPSSNIQLFDLDVLVTGRNVLPQITTLANTAIEGFYIGANVSSRFSLVGVTQIDSTHFKLHYGFNTIASGNALPESNFLVTGLRTFDCITTDIAIQPRFFEVKLYSPLAIISATPIIAANNVGISQKPLTTTNGTGSLTYTVDPSGDPLPAGFTLNSITGNITGSFNGFLYSNVVIKVTDNITNENAMATVPMYPSISVSGVTNFVAAVSTQTTVTPFTVTVGSGNYTFSLSSGTLPIGITLNSSTGALSGVLNNSDFANISITVSDNVTGQTTTVNNILIYAPISLLQSGSTTGILGVIITGTNVAVNITFGTNYDITFFAIGGSNFSNNYTILPQSTIPPSLTRTIINTGTSLSIRYTGTLSSPYSDRLTISDTLLGISRSIFIDFS